MYKLYLLRLLILHIIMGIYEIGNTEPYQHDFKLAQPISFSHQSSTS